MLMMMMGVMMIMKTATRITMKTEKARRMTTRFCFLLKYNINFFFKCTEFFVCAIIGTLQKVQWCSVYGTLLNVRLLICMNVGVGSYQRIFFCNKDFCDVIKFEKHNK